MTPSEIVKLQAFKLKDIVSNRFIVDALLDDPANADALKKDFKNVCSLLHIKQFDELTELCTLLSLTKREVISMALTDFIPKAHAVIAEVDPFASVPGINFEVVEEGK